MDSTVHFGRMIKVFGNLSFYSQANTGTTAICSFIAGMMTEEEDIQKIRLVFQKLDRNNDGYLTLPTLKELMRDYGETDLAVEKIFKAIDTECKGKIDF